jgi:ABC-type uncharacterized transport system substrate-binding protein
VKAAHTPELIAKLTENGNIVASSTPQEMSRLVADEVKDMEQLIVLDSVGTDAVLAFRNGLSEAGYADGHNVALEVHSTERYDQLPALAAEMVRRRVAVIAAIGGPAAPVAKAATATIPIVFSIGGDPVGLGLVSVLNRPGGNITGATFFTAQLLQKQVSLLHELAPNATVSFALRKSEPPMSSHCIA